jgi:RNA polymerase sigma-B factor
MTLDCQPAATVSAGAPHAPPPKAPAPRGPGAPLDHDARRGRPPFPANGVSRGRCGDENQLFGAAHDGDRAAREVLVERYLYLARRLARRYQRADVALDDLEQVASLALVRAVDAFDPTYGSRFSSYAVPCMTGALKHHFRDHTWAVRVPGALKALATRVHQGHEDALAATGRSPTAAELAESAGVRVEDVVEGRLVQQAYRAKLLSQPVESEDGDELSLLDALGEPDAELERVVDRAALDALLEQLDHDARTAIELYYRDELTQSEIADRLGCSQMQISRIIRGALVQLRATPDAGASARLDSGA